MPKSLPTGSQLKLKKKKMQTKNANFGLAYLIEKGENIATVQLHGRKSSFSHVIAFKIHEEKR